MGTALIKGFLAKGLLQKENLRAYDLDLEKPKALGLTAEYSAFEVVEKSDMVFICVKPQNIDDVLNEIEDITGSRLIVSIVAGVTSQTIESKLKEARVVRVMPNTPATINEMAAGYSLGSKASDEDGIMVGKLLASIGVAYLVDEKQIDAVTGLSGSGPAYIYYVIASMIDAGIKSGLNEQVAVDLVLQTVRGAVNMIIQTGREPADLIAEVSSPGGTTVEGLRVLDEAKVSETIAKAIEAATKRSAELGNKKSKKH